MTPDPTRDDEASPRGSGSAAKPSLREQRRGRERQDILAAASALFAEQGFRATTMQEIASRAEFSVGKIYSFYPSKEAIFDGLIEGFLDRMDGLIHTFDRPELPPLERLHAWLSGMIESGEKDRDLIRVGIVEARRGRHHYHPERRAGFVRKMTEILQAAVEVGELPPIRAQVYATMLQGAIEELTLAIGSEPDEPRFDEIPKLIFDWMVLPLADSRPQTRREEDR